jgi:hypothetical protein
LKEGPQKKRKTRPTASVPMRRGRVIRGGMDDASRAKGAFRFWSCEGLCACACAFRCREEMMGNMMKIIKDEISFLRVV